MTIMRALAETASEIESAFKWYIRMFAIVLIAGIVACGVFGLIAGVVLCIGEYL